MILTYDLCHELFSVNFQSGDIYWKARDEKWFNEPTRELRIKRANRWNGRCAGKKINRTSGGYVIVKINGKSYPAHRIIWLMAYGEWPKEEIDHKDRNKLNNSLENLREVSHQENCKNRGIRADNISGYPGVVWHKRDKIWEISIGIDGRNKYLGRAETIKAAIEIKKEAERKEGFGSD